MAFLLAAPPFNYSEGVIGLFGLAGAAGTLSARPAGGLADKGKSHLTTSAGLVLLLLSRAAIWYGHISVLALIVGIHGARSHRSGRSHHQSDRHLSREARGA